MQIRFILTILILLSADYLFAQSARVKPEETKQAIATVKDNLSAEKMYAEANDYSKIKFDEFNQKKIAFNEALRIRTLDEQKRLAAKYAALLSKREKLENEDFYYLGMLHWLAENFDGAFEALKRYLNFQMINQEKAQTSRGIVTIVAARRKNFPEAEEFFNDYIKNAPVKWREVSQMTNDLATSYFAGKNYDQAAFYGEKSYHAAKTIFPEQTSKARGLLEITDRGKNLFEIYRESGNQERTDATLEDLKNTAVKIESTSIYYFALDNQIKYFIETKRREKALVLSDNINKLIEKDFARQDLRDDLARRFNKKDRHYRLLGQPAPELVEITGWIPAQNKTLASLRGKVIVLDFWATWCGPCFDAFPYLTKMHQTMGKDGLEIIGITRLYGQVNGDDADLLTELKFLKDFKAKENLPYPFVIAQNNTNQILYGASAIPTVVIIDRQGLVRYIETGSNPTRGDEIVSIVKKLLAEK